MLAASSSSMTLKFNSPAFKTQPSNGVDVGRLLAGEEIEGLVELGVQAGSSWPSTRA